MKPRTQIIAYLAFLAVLAAALVWGIVHCGS